MMSIRQQLCTFRPTWAGMVAIAALCLPALVASPARSQFSEASASAEPGSAILINSVNASERNAEYAALARDVDALQLELGLVKRVVKLVTPAVVHIEARPRRQLQSLRNIQEAGSGTIVEFGSKQYVLTNRHVVRHSSPELIEIHLASGIAIHPQQIWSDPRTDVAIMQIGMSGQPAARLGNSDAVEIGDHVLAIGSPFGLSQSVTRGIISAKGRHNLNLGDEDSSDPNQSLLQDFLQTDAAINPGNSGGPLVNLRGEVIGLNTAIASASGGNEGIGFSVPINIASRVARALIDGKEGDEIPRGRLGVRLDINFTEAEATAIGLPRRMGTRVTTVDADSPAESAGMKVNDVIVEYNGVRIEHDGHLIGLVKLSEVGRSVDVVVIRDGKPLRLPVRIGNAADGD